MLKLILPEYPEANRSNTPSTIRLRPATMRRLLQMAFKTRMSNTDLASQLLDWAMQNVELKPVELYEVELPEVPQDAAE